MTTTLSVDSSRAPNMTTTPGPGEYIAANSLRGSMIGFGKSKTYRLSGHEDPRVQRTRNSPGPGKYDTNS